MTVIDLLYVQTINYINNGGYLTRIDYAHNFKKTKILGFTYQNGEIVNRHGINKSLTSSTNPV